MEIRALWSKIKFYVFYKNSPMKKIEKTSSLFKFYKIEFILWKKKNVDENKWNKNDKTSLPYCAYIVFVQF